MRHCAAIIAMFFLTLPVLAQKKPKPASNPKENNLLDDDVKKSTALALEYLASKQNSDGSWSAGGGAFPHNTAMTGFVLMAFMSQGHLPNQGKYGPEVAKGARFLINSARPSDGYLIGSQGGGRMYDHGMATLALSQLYGTTGDENIKKVLKRAVDLIVNCQSPDGGWRYEPVPRDSDISVTIMQVMALRGAKDGGMHVPEKTLKDALKYVQECRDQNSGGYKYQPRMGAPGFARTAAGICVLKLVGEYENDKVKDAVRYLKSHMEHPSEYYFYGHYYASHGMHQVGGEDWKEYYSMMKKNLKAKQSNDGSWSHMESGSVGPVYQTAIAVIILSVPANYLPIFQR